MVGLQFFDQLLDAAPLCFCVAMAGERIRAPRGLNQDVPPEDAAFEVDRGSFVNTHAHFVQREPGALAAYDRFVRDFNAGWEQEVLTRPPACGEYFGCHTSVLCLYMRRVGSQSNEIRFNLKPAVERGKICNGFDEKDMTKNEANPLWIW